MFRRFADYLAVIIALVATFSPLAAWSEFVPVALDPITHNRAVLRVVDANGESHAYTPDALEAFPTFSLTTTTPWREDAARFEGVRLSDVLAAHGLDSVASIEVVAENDFLSTIEQPIWRDDAILIATRVNGQAHTRRERGPIQFVVAEDALAADGLLATRHLVWMAALIRPAQ